MVPSRMMSTRRTSEWTRTNPDLRRLSHEPPLEATFDEGARDVLRVRDDAPESIGRQLTTDSGRECERLVRGGEGRPGLGRINPH